VAPRDLTPVFLAKKRGSYHVDRIAGSFQEPHKFMAGSIEHRWSPLNLWRVCSTVVE
jgi:hypothetical protein